MTPEANPYIQLMRRAMGSSALEHDPHKCKINGCHGQRVLQSNGYRRGLCRYHYNLYQKKYYVKKSDRYAERKALDAQSNRK